MLIVLDTNVLVSGLLNPFGAPGRILDLILTRSVRLAYDDRILAEYYDVLLRPRFGFETHMVRRLIDYLVFNGEAVNVPPLRVEAPDPDDLPFAEVAIGGHAKTLVTGNPAHFAFLQDPLVLSPADFLQYWAQESGYRAAL